MLHQKAGSENVVEFHGSMNTFTCVSCAQGYSLEKVMQKKLPPRCSCGEVLKPDVVFFDELIPPEAVHRADEMIQSADVLIVAGTSCQVVPASSLPFLVKQKGGKIIEINLEPALVGTADISLQGKFARTMRDLSAALDM
jgi:NAD-dependent deacetylase